MLGRVLAHIGPFEQYPGRSANSLSLANAASLRLDSVSERSDLTEAGAQHRRGFVALNGAVAKASAPSPLVRCWHPLPKYFFQEVGRARQGIGANGILLGGEIVEQSVEGLGDGEVGQIEVPYALANEWQA